MKVLLLFPQTDGQTGPGIKYSFEQLGHTVKVVDAKLRPGDSFRAALEFKPDLIFCSRTAALAEQIIKIKQKMNTIVCVWNVDTRTNIESWRHLFPLIKACDYYFVVASRLIPEWRKINKNTFWLPQGLQNEVYKKPETITNADKIKYSCDVCWAGDLGKVHSLRLPFIKAIKEMGINFKLWGCEGRPKIYNEEHNKMVALSKINIGCSCWPENEKYTSVRNYKILGAGGFLLEYYRAGLYDIFPENLIDSYSSTKEFIKKILYWLKNDEERKERAEKAYKWVRENVTYAHRIRMALKYMKLGERE